MTSLVFLASGRGVLLARKLPMGTCSCGSVPIGAVFVFVLLVYYNVFCLVFLAWLSIDADFIVEFSAF